MGAKENHEKALAPRDESSSLEDKLGLPSAEDKYPCKLILDRNIAHLELIRPRLWVTRYDILPFLAVYVLLYAIHSTAESETVSLVALVALPIWLFVHLLVLMCEYWIIRFRIFMAYQRVPIETLTQLVQDPRKLRAIYQRCKARTDAEYAQMLKSYQLSLRQHLATKAEMERRRNEAKDPQELQRQRMAMKLSEALGFNSRPVKPTRPRTALRYSDDVSGTDDGSAKPIYVHIVPIEHHGSATLCPLVFNDDSLSSEFVPPFMFEFHHFTYLFNHSVPTRVQQGLDTSVASESNEQVQESSVRSRRPQSSQGDSSKVEVTSANIQNYYDFTAPACFTPLLYPDRLLLTEYANANGITDEEEVSRKLKLFGPNAFQIPPPTFSELFVQHAMAPFFVFQVFCVTLWMLDEYWYYSLFTLFLLILFESMVVARRISQFKDIISMRPPPAPVYVYRNKKWKIVLNDDLVPGDIISITRAAAPLDASAKMQGIANELKNQRMLEELKDEEGQPAEAPKTSSASSSSSEAQKFDRVCPCDVILLEGTCVVNEAMLTGESVPQLKEGLNESLLDDIRDAKGAPKLDIEKAHKRHIVFGGTKVLMVDHTARDVGKDDNKESGSQDDIEGNAASAASATAVTVSGKKSVIPPAPDGGLAAYVLRTGFGSFQGGLVRTILLSTEANAIDVEALAFIGCMMVFAIISAYHVFSEGIKDPNRSRYKLLLNCITIITSVVPPEIPMELSLAVNNSMMALAKLRIFCTEPFRILTAGAVDVCCFDKTGTLTADQFILKGVGGLGEATTASADSSTLTKLVPPRSTPLETRIVLGGCHELALVTGPGGGLVGDPMEREVFQKAGFEFVSSSKAKHGGPVVHSQESGLRMYIQHRFPFSSAKKRMAAIVLVDGSAMNGQRKVYSVVKGAPEVLEPRFSSVPSNYAAIHRTFACQGGRVLALGYRDITSIEEASTISRDMAESNLSFAGFLVLQSPLKPDSAEVIEHLSQSSHRIVMITGDHVLTACHVARELKIATKPLVILTKSDERPDLLVWRAFDPRETFVANFDASIDPEALRKFASQYDFCISGEALQQLLEHSPQVVAAAAKRFSLPIQEVRATQISHVVAELYRYTAVFARTMPDQKEHILAWLKKLGYGTLMCGDGTNDVGALKQADIGIALLSSDVAAAEEELKKERQQRELKFKQEMQAIANLPREERVKRELERAKEAFKMMDEEPTVRLGDASIAAPFTSKDSSVNVTASVIRLGRCTLVTTIQLFQILAINSLILAYSLSVLYLEGVKYSDAQFTIASAAISIYFFAMSQAEPIERLSEERPHTRIFSRWMILTVVGQFAIHLGCLMYAVQLASPYSVDPEHRNPEGKFAPNVLNSTIYLVSTAMTVACFLANYRGRPFMPSLKENNKLYKALMAGLLYVVVLTTEMIPELNEYLELVPWPTAEYRNTVLMLVLGDVALTYALGRFLTYYFRIIPEKPRS